MDIMTVYSAIHSSSEVAELKIIYLKPSQDQEALDIDSPKPLLAQEPPTAMCREQVLGFSELIPT